MICRFVKLSVNTGIIDLRHVAVHKINKVSKSIIFNLRYFIFGVNFLLILELFILVTKCRNLIKYLLIKSYGYDNIKN